MGEFLGSDLHSSDFALIILTRVADSPFAPLPPPFILPPMTPTEKANLMITQIGSLPFTDVDAAVIYSLQHDIPFLLDWYRTTCA